MILAPLSHSSRHEGLHPLFAKAFNWLQSYNLSTTDGRYEIDGPGLIAIVQRYETARADAKKWETHRVYGDIQYMVEGSELIGYAVRDNLVVRTPYSPEKDAEFYDTPDRPTSGVVLSAGSFAVFHPEDAHQPGVMIGQPAVVHKVVMKFLL